MHPFCTNCLEDIPADELYFEAVSRRGQRVVLCRVCFYDNEFIPDHMKETFARQEEQLMR